MLRGRILRVSRLRRCYSSDTSSTAKPIVLEKPERFNPPSHGRRHPNKVPKYYGPPISAQQREEMKTKQYPNMMPPEGTFMNWFLRNRAVHLVLALGSLSFLAIYIACKEFVRNTPYAYMLPPASAFFSSPLSSLSMYIEVFKLETERNTAIAAAKRKQLLDDVQKRTEYRKAHGLDAQGAGLIGWLGGTEQPPTSTETEPSSGEQEDQVLVQESGSTATKGRATYTDFDGQRRPVKKWLGIW